MPFNRLHPFLWDISFIYSQLSKVCQCPSTGLHYFYGREVYPVNGEYSCVNALQRAYIISTSITGSSCIRDNARVSMPFNGLTLFPLEAAQETVNQSTVCQCPSTGLHYFYPALLEAPVYKALKGAFSPRFFKLLQKCYILPIFWFF